MHLFDLDAESEFFPLFFFLCLPSCANDIVLCAAACYLFFFNLLFLFSTVSSSSLRMRLQSETAVTGQRDVPLKPDEFTVGESTGEELIVSPSVQSTPSACHISLFLCLHTHTHTPNPPIITLQAPCRFPCEACAPAVSGFSQSSP